MNKKVFAITILTSLLLAGAMQIGIHFAVKDVQASDNDFIMEYLEQRAIERYYMKKYLQQQVDAKRHSTAKHVKQAKKDVNASKRYALNKLFKQYRSPLLVNVDTFIGVANKYNLDWRLLPAISIIESGGGKHLFRRYNPFGWGKSNFSSFNEAIGTVGRGLKVGYYNKGCKTVSCISRLYCPPNSKKWANDVRYIMNLLSYYKAEYERR